MKGQHTQKQARFDELDRAHKTETKRLMVELRHAKALFIKRLRSTDSRH
jgi:hypothetical protein